MKAWVLKIWDMTIWDRIEQGLVGILGLAALACALWQVLSRYLFPQHSIGYAEEVIVYLLKGNFKRAIRRFGSPSIAIVGGVRVDVYYHSVRSIGRMLGPAFRLEEVMGLCSLSPAPGWEHLQRSRLIRALAAVDHTMCRLPLTASLITPSTATTS